MPVTKNSTIRFRMVDDTLVIKEATIKVPLKDRNADLPVSSKYSPNTLHHGQCFELMLAYVQKIIICQLIISKYST